MNKQQVENIKEILQENTEDSISNFIDRDDILSLCDSWLELKAANDLANEEIRHAYNDNETHRQRIAELEDDNRRHKKAVLALTGKVSALIEVAKAANSAYESCSFCVPHQKQPPTTCQGAFYIQELTSSLAKARGILGEK